MEKKRQVKWTIAKILLIMAFLFPVAGTNVAGAGVMGDSAYYATVGNIYQGYSQYYSAMAILAGSNSYQYYAWDYMLAARDYMDEAWWYAGFYSTQTGYWAYLYADDAYWLYYDAEVYAWNAYWYRNTTYSLYAIYLGGLGAYNGAISQYYSAMDSYGGIY